MVIAPIQFDIRPRHSFACGQALRFVAKCQCWMTLWPYRPNSGVDVDEDRGFSFLLSESKYDLIWSIYNCSHSNCFWKALGQIRSCLDVLLSEKSRRSTDSVLMNLQWQIWKIVFWWYFVMESFIASQSTFALVHLYDVVH